MATSNDKFKRLARKWVGSIGAGGVADGTVTTIPLSSSSGLPTDTAVVVTIDRVDANGVATPSLEESVVGVVSGDNLVTCTRGVEGTAQAHSAGAVVEILFTNKVWGDLIDGILAEHNQDGTHSSITARVLAITSSATPTINTDNYDAVSITALAENITSMTTNLSGTPTNFQGLIFRIKDNGTPRTIAWGSSFEPKGVALPETTTAGKAMTVGFLFDSVAEKWGCVAMVEEV